MAMQNAAEGKKDILLPTRFGSMLRLNKITSRPFSFCTSPPDRPDSRIGTHTKVDKNYEQLNKRTQYNALPEVKGKAWLLQQLTAKKTLRGDFKKLGPRFSKSPEKFRTRKAVAKS